MHTERIFLVDSLLHITYNMTTTGIINSSQYSISSRPQEIIRQLASLISPYMVMLVPHINAPLSIICILLLPRFQSEYPRVRICIAHVPLHDQLIKPQAPQFMTPYVSYVTIYSQYRDTDHDDLLRLRLFVLIFNRLPCAITATLQLICSLMSCYVACPKISVSFHRLALYFKWAKNQVAFKFYFPSNIQ